MRINRPITIAAAMLAATISLATEGVRASDSAELDAQVAKALAELEAHTPSAKELAAKAAGILVFPEITKAGLIVGGETGEGALLKEGETAGYYSITSISVGMQGGVETYSNVLMFMTDDALSSLDDGESFELGVDSGVTVIDKGLGGELSTTTIQTPIVAYVFGAEGLMAGNKLEGTEIHQIEK